MQTLLLNQRAERLTNQQRIMKMIGWTELEYSAFIHDTGLDYLYRYIPTDYAGIEALIRSRVFWNWWKNQWAIRDAEFLLDDDPSVANYKWHHSPRRLVMEIFPDAVVLGLSYASMIHDFNKSIV